jgi:hypothetical protein
MTLRASELSQQMVNQLPNAWSQIKGTSFPGGDTKDAEVMFRAVALGLLSYLQTAQGQDPITSIDPAGVTPSFNVASVVWKTDLT